jgi:pSer/pThr/pTyr-binding forkhead associated (FHA) protein
VGSEPVKPPAPDQAAAQPAPPAAEPAAHEPARELVAVLAAPTLSSGGAVFPVRLGKSFVGAHPSNDICLRGDSQVSGEHALVLARSGRFYLSDRMSTNGTWVNGEEVGAGGQVELVDHDRIRCGATELVLLVLPTPGGVPPRRAK